MEKLLIKAVCFDLDGVFFTEASFKKYKNTISELTDFPEKVDDVFHGDMMKSFKTGRIEEDYYWNYVIESLNLKIKKFDLYSILRESYEINSNVLDIVEKVNRSEILTCICSNNFVTRIRELDCQFDFLKLFTIKIFSFEVGFLKPSTEIFQELINECRLNSEEILYSDDNELKLKGAEELGINAFQYNNIDTYISELKKYCIL